MTKSYTATFSAALLASTVATGAMAQTIIRASMGVPSTDLIAPLASSSPQLHFHEGQVVNNAPYIDPVLPKVPGPPSPWTLSQWNHDPYIHPTDLQTFQGPNGPIYTFIPQSADSFLIEQRQSHGPGYIFSLFNSNGTLTDGGGRATYLSTNLLPNVNASFDHDITLAMDVRVSYAHVHYTTPEAESTGAVLGMAYTGLGLLFVDPATNAAQFVFMQEPLTLSRSQPNQDGFVCAGTTPVLFAPSVLPNNKLAFRTDPGPLHHVTYNLKSSLLAMLSHPTPCGGTQTVWTPAQLNPANWSLTGMYVGSETENTDLRTGAATTQPQGDVELGLDVANLTIKRQVQ